MDTTYDEFLKTESLVDRPAVECLNILGSAVDFAGDNYDSHGLKHALNLVDTIDTGEYDDEHRTLLDYFAANAWSALKQLRGLDDEHAWEWNCLEIEKELFYLRKARRSSGFKKLPAIRKCQILTNEGNCLDHLGRFVESIEPWNVALSINPEFGMAKGNRGIGLWTYACSLYDDSYVAILANSAWRDLNSEGLHGVNAGAALTFQNYRNEIEAQINGDVLKKEFDLDTCKIDGSVEYQDYRTWCLQYDLNLNPINDLGAFKIAVSDVLSCPSVVTDTNTGPVFHGFFNQIKQEFCSARWIAYEGMMSASPHISDRGVTLVDTLDYPSYSLSTEKLRLSFRSLYSVFDKIAYFLNAYFELKIPERDVSFRSLWYEKKNKRCVREEFRRRPNLALRGLYWLAKDLYENRQEFQDVIDPDARQLNTVRNHLEHKYLKIHLDLWQGKESETSNIPSFTDSLAYSIARSEFENMVYRLLSLSRAALIYLVLGIHREEQLRARTRSSDSPTVPILLDVWEDEWKC